MDHNEHDTHGGNRMNKRQSTESESRIRAFCTGLPGACGVPEDIAKIEADANGARFDHEVANKESAYSRRPGQPTRHRMKPAFAAWADLAEPKRLAYGIDLLCYAADCYGYNKTGQKHPKELVDTGIRLAALEPAQPEIAELYTVSEAKTQGQWA